MLKKNFKIVFPILLLFFLLGAGFVFAQEIIYPRIPGAVPPQDFLNDPSVLSENILSLYVKYFFNLALWLAGIIALGALIYGGVRYLLSTGKPEAIISAKNQIIYAFFGLLILLSSFLILKTLNPQFIILKLSEPEPIEIAEKPSITPPPVEEFRSSINTEIPFGTIIEKGVFEGIISCDKCGEGAANICDEAECLNIGPWCEFQNGIYGDCIEKETPRIPRIYNNSVITKQLADALKQQSEDLKGYSDQCTCRATKPVTPCGGNKSGDTTWKCGCDGYAATEPVTSDPCSPVRADIQDTEKKNRETIYSGTDITYTNKSGEDITIKTSLVQEQIKTEEEVRLLKEQLNRLERAEKFILECYEWLDSLAVLLANKDFFAERGEKDILRETKFWDEILIKGDWATFYCPVSGTIIGEAEYIPILEEEVEEMPTIEEPGEEESPACTTEVPVGEIIDRTKRVGYKLVERMEELIELDKELTEAVDELQVLISQCSSQRGCERRCSCFPCLPECMYKRHGSWHCRPGAKGWDYGCADSSLPYPGECKERDENTPCPYPEIKKQLEEIQKIWQEITDVINGKDEGGKTPEERLERTGILPIINEIIPEILENLNSTRKEMRYCVTDIPLKETEIPEVTNTLLVCGSTERAVGPSHPAGEIIQKCCLEEPEEEPFQDCLEECYLAKDYEEYKKCLYDCIETLPEDLNKCRHRLNFYCCQF